MFLISWTHWKFQNNLFQLSRNAGSAVDCMCGWWCQADLQWAFGSIVGKGSLLFQRVGQCWSRSWILCCLGSTRIYTYSVHVLSTCPVVQGQGGGWRIPGTLWTLRIEKLSMFRGCAFVTAEKLWILYTKIWITESLCNIMALKKAPLFYWKYLATYKGFY